MLGLIVSCWVPGKPDFFLGDKGKWEKSGGGGTWQMEGGEAVVWMYYMKEEKKLIFSKKNCKHFFVVPSKTYSYFLVNFFVLF